MSAYPKACSRFIYSLCTIASMKHASIENEEELARIVSDDEWMMKVLKAAEELDLPDWWIGAGFLRNKAWDYMEGRTAEATRDVDLVYFNTRNVSDESDWNYDNKMMRDYPFAKWRVRNQARMHTVNGLDPFASTKDGIGHWSETATCIGVRLEEGKPRFLFCYGSADLFELIARPAPFMIGTDLMKIFHDRIENKKWRELWPDLRIELK
jgi:uncharacterized protein